MNFLNDPTLTFKSSDDIIAEINKQSSIDKRLRCSEEIILHHGPRSFKLATLHEIQSEHTGEHHHYTLKIFSFKRQSQKNDWSLDETRSIILDDEKIDQIGMLREFLTGFEERMSLKHGTYYVIPENKLSLQTEAELSPEVVQGILENPESFALLLQQGGADLLKNLLQLATQPKHIEELISKLQLLDSEDLNDMSAALGLAQLKKFVQIWYENPENADEEFWQRHISQFSGSLSQLFSCPTILTKDKAYLGGKKYDNLGGNVVDFLCANEMTKNVMLVEIKTPVTPLLAGKQYRQTYPLSSDLSGAVGQVSKYRHVLQKHFLDTFRDTPYGAFNPKAVLIAGNTSQLDKELASEAFELQRSNLKEIDIVTFDEFFRKIEMLIQTLEGTEIR